MIMYQDDGHEEDPISMFQDRNSHLQPVMMVHKLLLKPH